MENMSQYFFLVAMEKHFIRKYPDQGQLIGEICSEIGRVMRVEEPNGVAALVGGAGMLQAWDDYFRERELRSTS